MKKTLLLAMTIAMGITASAYAANPFSDVPAGHWAYDAVNKLAAEGVVEGYPDGTYGGNGADYSQSHGKGRQCRQACNGICGRA